MQESKKKAEEALKKVPEIEASIEEAEEKTRRALDDLADAEENARLAREIAELAQGVADMASEVCVCVCMCVWVQLLYTSVGDCYSKRMKYLLVRVCRTQVYVVYTILTLGTLMYSFRSHLAKIVSKPGV